MPKGCSRQSSEHELHLHAWQWARKTHSKLLIFHVPNGGNRNIAEAVKFKRMGVLPGVSDFLCFTSTRKIAIELKDSDGEKSIDQERFENHWKYLGGEYYICRTLTDFQNLINAIVMF